MTTSLSRFVSTLVESSYNAEQSEYWSGVSRTAREFVRECLTVDPTNRPTTSKLLNHKWLKLDEQSFVTDPSSDSGKAVDLLPNVKAAFDAKKTCESDFPVRKKTNETSVRKAVLGMMAIHRFQDHNTVGGGQTSAEKEKFAKEVEKYKEEAERVSLHRDLRIPLIHFAGGRQGGHVGLFKRIVTNQVDHADPIPFASMNARGSSTLYLSLTVKDKRDRIGMHPH